MNDGTKTADVHAAMQRAAEAVRDAEAHLEWCAFMRPHTTYVRNARDNLVRCRSELEFVRREGQTVDQLANGGSSYL